MIKIEKLLNPRFWALKGSLNVSFEIFKLKFDTYYIYSMIIYNFIKVNAQKQ